MNIPKTAIVGATGLIGKAFFSLYQQIYPDCIGTTRNIETDKLKYLDLLSSDVASLKLSTTGHKNAIIAAGIAKILLCEKEKEYSKKITDGTLNLVRQLVDEGIKPIYISSDYVFDGYSGNYEDDSNLNPLNEYGKQKAEIEEGIKRICKDNYLIVRFSKVFTLKKGDGTIFDEMAASLVSGKTIRAAQDQIFSPTLLSDSVNAVKYLQLNDFNGIVNVSSPEIWSRYDLAIKMAEFLELKTAKIEKISLEDLSEEFVRPKNTSMNVEKLIKETNISFMPIDKCMKIIAKNWTT